MFLLSSVAAMAQVASGNVAESSNPRSAVIDAQNFLAQRTIEGCVVQQGSDYLLVPKHGRPEELTSNSGDKLSQSVGCQVKVHGRETYAGDSANPEADYIVAADQIEVVAQSCPANWNEKWVKRSSPKP
jgi:hypothetical protein